MKEAFILDLNFLKEQNLSVIEFITLLQLNEIDTGLQLDLDILHNLQEKQFVKLIIDKFGTNTIIREKSKLLLDFLSIESSYSDYKSKKVVKKSTRIISEGFDEFIEEYRKLWKGLKVGSLGSYKTCYDKMKRWMSENPNYSKEDILKAARIYIKSLDNYQYLQQADYFIFIKDGKDENSRLSAFIDEQESNNTDWTVKLS